MEKKIKPESKGKKNQKGVANQSKAIAKNKQKALEKVEVKKETNTAVKVPVSGKAPAKTGAAPPSHAGVDKKKNQKKNKNKSANNAKIEAKLEKGQENVKVEQATLKEDDASKIEKRKAKKLAQKLKKQQTKSEKQPKGGPGKPKNKKDVKGELTSVEGDKLQVNGDAADETKQANQAKNLKKKQNKVKGENRAKEKQLRNETRLPHAELEAATVFVGNLPINTKRVQIVRIFKPYGTVNAVRLRTAAGKSIYKHKQRKEAGSLNAYVVLQDVEKAKAALALNGSEFKGNHLRVTAADSKTRDDTDAKRTVFVGNLKYTANEEKLREIFSSCGELEYIRCLQESDKGCKGVAYVCFKSPEAVGLALELNETVLDERPIHVERYSVKKLGAKETRDAAAEADKKPKAKKATGPGKKQQKGAPGKKGAPVKGAAPAANGTDASGNKKKGDFRGVKVENASGGIAKKKNKKITGERKQLVKKIAPKPKTEV